MPGRDMGGFVVKGPHLPRRQPSNAPKRASLLLCNVREKRRQAAEEPRCRLRPQPHQLAPQHLLRLRRRRPAGQGCCLNLCRLADPLL